MPVGSVYRADRHSPIVQAAVQVCYLRTTRGDLDESHIHQASSERRLVIEATYSL